MIKDECRDCPALCCRDLALMIHKPRTRAEINDVKWYLYYDKVNICIRQNRWYIVVKSKCIYLDGNNRCRIYRDRPDRCRRHTPPNARSSLPGTRRG